MISTEFIPKHLFLRISRVVNSVINPNSVSFLFSMYERCLSCSHLIYLMVQNIRWIMSVTILVSIKTNTIYGIKIENFTQIKVYKFLVFAQISIVCVYHKRHGCAIVLNSKWLMEKFSIFRISLLRKIGIDENKHVWFCVCNVKSLNTNINEKISCPRDMNCQYIKKKIWFETKLYHPNRIVIHAIINESYTPLCMVTWNKSFFF